MGFFPVADRYESHLRSSAWQMHARSCLALTGRRCVLFPFLWAQECHHLHYRNLGREVPVVDTVPLSWAAHQIIHFPLLWFPPVRVAVNVWLRLMMVLLAITSPLRRWSPIVAFLLVGVAAVATWQWAAHALHQMTTWF
jgi:hypothetical protein